MSDCYIYDIYKPKTYQLPCDFEAKFRYVHEVGAKLLSRFSEQQLIDATRRLDQAVLDSGEYLGVKSVDEWEDSESTADYSDTKDEFLHEWMAEGRDMSALLGLPAVTWAECYALAGISLIAYAYRLEMIHGEQQRIRDHRSRTGAKSEDELMFEELAAQHGPAHHPDCGAMLMELWDMAEYAVESTKLAATALTLSGPIFTHEEYRSLLREQTSKGGKKRALRYSALKELVLQRYFAEHSHRSNRDAAKRIYSTLSEHDLMADDGRPVLSTDDPVKRLAEWIGAEKPQGEG